MPTATSRRVDQRRIQHKVSSAALQDKTLSGLEGRRHPCLLQGWSLSKAREAVEEYRRFCFLACAAGHPVTPSEEVDAVWHLHLLHTRDYWEVFCPQVLERPLHHGPTLGGAAEENRFYEQYAQTLASYQRFFGAPPTAWWPRAAQRFQPSNRWRWVYLPHVWIVPHPRSWLTRLFSFLNKETA